jgi:membrane protease YdiL (CAAX protease family)
VSYAIAVGLCFLAWIAIIVLNETHGLLRCDDFPNAFAKIFAYLWLGFFMIVTGFVTTFAAAHQPTSEQLAKTPFYALFELHAMFIIFLLGWWLATRRPPLMQFLNIRRENAGEAVLAGFAVGFGGWIFTIVLILLFALILKGAGLMPDKMEPPAMIAFLAHVAWWKKALIVGSAMTVEEALFRGFLQKRIGLIASTILFALAHTGLGQPMLLVGVSIISLVIGTTFYRTKNLIPGIVAHGVFDAVQLFVIIPIVFGLSGMS